MEPILTGFQSALFQNETKSVLEFSPALAAGIRLKMRTVSWRPLVKNNSGIHRIFRGGNRGHGMFQPRHWPCFRMVLTLLLHRQLTSLTENCDCFVQQAHKIAPAKSGRNP